MFSLTELEHCVIKGFLSRPHPHAVKKGHIPMKLPSDADDHYSYSITIPAAPSPEGGTGSTSADNRIHFLLNNGSLTCPSKIYIMKPMSYNKICMDACQAYLADAVNVDVRRWSVMLPRIFDIYRNDFGEDNVSILLQCKKLVEFSIQNEIQDVIVAAKNASSVNIKFHKNLCESRKNLEVIDTV